MLKFKIAVNLMLLFFVTLNMNSCKQNDGPLTPKSGDGSVLLLQSVENKDSGMAPDFVCSDGNNNFRFSEFTSGKVVMLNFWGTWCGPCVGEIPDLIELSNELVDRKFALIGICCEYASTDEDKKSKVSEFAIQKNIPYMLIIANTDIQNAFGGISAVRTSFIIDKSGKIVKKIIGAYSKESYLNIINQYL
jgi:thiol-disulfide isomerase/thioredoxin